MFKHWGLPFIACIGVGLGIYMVHLGNKQPPTPPIPFMPPQSPYSSYIAGSGIVEASSENVPIGVSNGQIIDKMFVQAGDFCKQGTPLFQLDARVFNAQLEQAKAQVEVAKADLTKLLKEPREEEVPPLEFDMYEQEALWNKSKAHLDIYGQVQNTDAISKDEYQNAYYDEKATSSSFKKAQANLSLKLAGAWILDIQIAAKTLAEREAEVAIALAQLDQTLIRAPFDGRVLQVKLYPGSFAQSYYDVPYTNAMLLFGRVDPLHIRISIDEEDAWRYREKSPATAFVRGNGKLFAKLEFVRTEPFIVPKKSLTGDDTEQTDTRVLEIIYKFSKENLPIYVGQLMDIYVEAPAYDDEK